MKPKLYPESYRDRFTFFAGIGGVLAAVVAIVRGETFWTVAFAAFVECESFP